MTMIEARYAMTDLEHKDAPLDHHRWGVSYTRTGYGKKIPTRSMVKLPGSNRWRRVYCCCFSNNGTCYVTSGKNWIVIY